MTRPETTTTTGRWYHQYEVIGGASTNATCARLIGLAIPGHEGHRSHVVNHAEIAHGHAMTALAIELNIPGVY